MNVIPNQLGHDADDLLRNLNAPQRRAVLHRDGPVLVLAGPGSGKTRVITSRAAQLVRTGVASRHILAITFTNKAANEMRRRIENLGVARGMWIYTFHALGVRLLREFARSADLEPGFSIYDEDDRMKLVREAMELARVSEDLIKPDVVQAKISRLKNRLETPRTAHEQAGYFEDRSVARIYEHYETLLKRRNAVDFDDLLMKVALLLRDDEEILERLNERFRYVLIDEYQDTNRAQYLIARLLTRKHRNLCVTGDPDQSIYAWRGADLSNILQFEQDYPDAQVIRLEQNYRSTQSILRAADRLIAANVTRKPKQLWTENPAGEPVQVLKFAEGRDEAEHIAETIAELHAEGLPYSDFAIAYRVNAVSRGIEQALRERRIPYKVARGVEFYNRREIKDVLAYLKVLVNPADNVALGRIINTPARGIGKTTIDRLEAAAMENNVSLMDALRNAHTIDGLRSAYPKLRGFLHLLDQMQPLVEGSAPDAVSGVLKLSGLEQALRAEDVSAGEDRLANVQELVSAAVRYQTETPEPSLADFLHQISLVSDQDAIDESAGVVLLLTLHAAKGLEFPVVFIAGLEQGMLPHERAIRGDGDIEEERRLLFVGMTRARQRLFLSHARERLIRGRFIQCSPSQFLLELPEDAISMQTIGPAGGRWDRPRCEDPDRMLDSEDPRREIASPRPRRRLRATSDEFESDDAWRSGRVSRPVEPVAQPGGVYGDWKAGTLVQHDHFGVGQVVWIQPAGDKTRASIRFAGYGERTFVLEFAPVRKLERRAR